MRIFLLLLNPAIFGILALFASIVWMLRDQRDKVRPLLVFALTVNLFFGFLLTYFMSREGSLFSLKYDYILFNLDHALGLPSTPIARALLGALRVPLVVVYELMVPMMVAWFVASAYVKQHGGVVLALGSEMIAGPMLYALVPGCGPIYAFGEQWLNPPQVAAQTVHLVGMPNAFPSLHVATAFVLLLFAPGKWWRSAAVIFFAGTCMATLATGEHYTIDLVAGLAFGCFASQVGRQKWRNAAAFAAVSVGWSLSVRFGYRFLMDHGLVLQALAALTVLMAGAVAVVECRSQRGAVAEIAAATAP